MKDKSSYRIPGTKEISFFRKKITGWLKKNERNYPWRKTNDPFRFLVAELMLRRTRADQVKEVYIDFFNRFPDQDSIFKARDEDIGKILYPLGLRKRFPLVRLLAQEIKEEFSGKIPLTRDKLKNLPGVGDYSSGALLSIMFGKKEWMVDSNVVRLFKRYFGLETSSEGRRDRHIIQLAENYVSSGNPRNNNLALLDFSALVCKPVGPGCSRCILSKVCKYNKNN